MKEKPIKLSPITDRTAALQILADIQELMLEIQTAKTLLESDVAQLQKDFEVDTGKQTALVKTHLKRLKSWAIKHPDEFADQRSIETPHGKMGFRKNSPSLGLIGDESWETVLAELESLPDMEKYIRTKSEVDKRALLDNREELGADGLLALGVEIVQKEEFFVEPKLAAVETRLKEGN